MLYDYYWCENGETKLVKCSSNGFLLCIVGAFNIFGETALILNEVQPSELHMHPISFLFSRF